VVDWVDVFTRNIYKNILLGSFRFCQINQGLQIGAWVIMPNHFHLIASFKDGFDPGLVLKNIKSFTAIKIIDAIINNPKESRKSWMLSICEQHGTLNKAIININSGNTKIILFCSIHLLICMNKECSTCMKIPCGLVLY
jgi:putative transposase